MTKRDNKTWCAHVKKDEDVHFQKNDVSRNGDKRHAEIECLINLLVGDDKESKGLWGEWLHIHVQLENPFKMWV